jgi:uncharacterized protein (DUF2235 family)
MAEDIKRMAACFDGTWNTEKSNTNVSRLFRLIARETNGCTDQRVFYDEGVGTGLGERIRGGVLGMGLDVNIRQGYAWLGAQFALAGAGGATDDDGFLHGPDLYLFGFSRGAFTARSLGGLINFLGLPRLGSMPGDKPSALCEDAAVLRAWALYETRPTLAEREAAARGEAKAAQRVAEHNAAAAQFRANHAHHPVRIHFIGVWDTVGALGIPRVFDRWSLLRPSTKYRFHDTQLGRCVRHAYHAVAVDEQRQPYCVALWSGHDPATTHSVEQRWFPGAHADVGGGYEDSLLPDPPLAWLATMAAAQGLHFVNDRGAVGADGTRLASLAQMPAAFELDGREYLSPVHDSYAEFLYGAYKLLRSLPLIGGGRTYRRMLVPQDGIAQSVDETANLKVAADPAYRPPNLAQAGRLDVNYPIARLHE